MEKMTRKYIIILMLLFTALTMNAQVLKLIRTDVDTARDGFVTAKYLFGVDVVANDLNNCSAVSFALKWTQQQYIKFSEWKIGYLGDSAAAYVFPQADEFSDEGILYVGITSGEPEVSRGYDNPNFIHFEFAVLRSAPNNTETQFTFITARANVNADTARYDIKLETEPKIYMIHSFMDVWPGDTDNNGIVDQDDVLPIDKYFDFGSEVKSTKTFKRENASTIWKAQNVLAWDEADAAFADCDGNGVVNESDVLILGINSGKTHGKAYQKSDPPLSEIHDYSAKSTSTSVAIPVRLGSSMAYSGAAGVISWELPEPGVKVLGISNGDLFGRNNGYLLAKINEKESKAHFAVYSLDGTEYNGAPGTIAYLIVEPNGVDVSKIKVRAESLEGISSDGYMFPISAPLSVDENTGSEKTICSVTGDFLRIYCSVDDNGPAEMIIYDLPGNIIKSEPVANNGGSFDIKISKLAPGAYYGLIKNAGTLRRFTFIKPF